MTKLIIYDRKCQILDENDDSFLSSLDNHLSFRMQGMQFSKAYKEGFINDRGEQITWDGITRLLNGDLRFPIGLLERVLDYYKLKNKEIEVIDERIHTQASSIDISKKLKELNIVPRDYQIEAANTACQKNRGIIRAATGAGKTLIAALIAANLGKPTIIYVIGQDLLYQFHKFFSAIFDEEIGIIGDGKCEIRRVNIATVWSIGKAINVEAHTLDEESEDEKEIAKEKFKSIKLMLQETSVHILDECHLAACETIQAVSHKINAEHFYGMSASPWRDDGADLLIEAILGRKIVDISARLLISKGYLVNPTVRFLSVPPYNGAKSAVYKTVYKNYITVNADRNAMIVKAATRLVEQGFKVLVLFKTKAHGKKLFDLLKSQIKCDLLSGEHDTNKRKEVCDNINSGKIDCIIASTIFDIGVDLPILSALVIGGGGKSSVRALQRVGRVIRLYKEKKMAVVIDFADQAPFLRDHSEIRKKILQEEFENIQWPQEKQKQ